jgi:signal transduction histidine kinase
MALAVAAVYFVIAGVYVAVSSRVAARVAGDVAELHRVETMKGLIYVAVTSIVVFGAALAALRRLDRTSREIARQREALMTSERQAFAGVMASTVAHDANNVLTALLAELDIIGAATTDDEEALANARMAAERLVALNRRLLDVTRQTTKTEMREFDLRRAVRESLHTLRAHPELRRCAITLVGHEGALPVCTSPVLMHQVLSNLVVNAGQATQGAGHVEIALAKDDRSAIIEVHDDGPGVPSERREGLFSALKTTKANGNGLGLYSASACLRAVGGTIVVNDSRLGGACFRVTLPLQMAATA